MDKPRAFNKKNKFLLFLLFQKDFDTFHEPFFKDFLCFTQIDILHKAFGLTLLIPIIIQL